MEALNKQVGGSHYKKGAIQPIEFILANDIPFCEGSVIKYVFRWREKGGINDLEKAKHYLDFLIDQEKSRSPSPLPTALWYDLYYPQQEKELETTSR